MFERLVHHQVIDYKSHKLFRDNHSRFKKSHLTTTVILGIRNDIMHILKHATVTLMVLTDFSKAYDRIKNKTVIKKLNLLGFWMIQYLTGSKQFKQIDDKRPELCNTNFCVPRALSWEK